MHAFVRPSFFRVASPSLGCCGHGPPPRSDPGCHGVVTLTRDGGVPADTRDEGLCRSPGFSGHVGTPRNGSTRPVNPTSPGARPGPLAELLLPAAAARHAGCSSRRNCKVNLDELRWDRRKPDCEPLQARGILAVFNWTRQLDTVLFACRLRFGMYAAAWVRLWTPRWACPH
jgi:hypothetical protein